MKFKYKGVDVVFPDVGQMYASCFEKGEFYENDFLEYVASLKKDGTYLDIGCNLGNHALFFAKFTNCTKVIAFEPILRFIENIKKTIALNNCKNITLIEVAASDSVGEFELSFLGKSYHVKKDTVDSMSLDNVSIVKIDVEGMESLVIAGARETIGRCKPIIFAEANNNQEKDLLFQSLAVLDYSPTGRVFNVSPTYEFVANV